MAAQTREGVRVCVRKETADLSAPLRSVEKHFHERSVDLQSLGFARDDNGKDNGSIEVAAGRSGCWTQAFFHHLGWGRLFDGTTTASSEKAAAQEAAGLND
jgi:hypothetical protein